MSRRLAEGVHADIARPDGPATAAVVAFGANLGDRAATIAAALDELRALPLVDDVRASDVVESVAITLEGEDASAPAYLNGVAIVTTRLAPSMLLAYLHAIENRFGRERRERWGARTLDLDLISFGDVRSDTSALQLPHPRAAEREFVLVPWLSIDPDAQLPGQGRVDALLARLRSTT